MTSKHAYYQHKGITCFSFFAATLCSVFTSALVAADSAERRNAYFGDLHVHTRYSPDAYIFSVRVSPDDAYRFALGEPIKHANGYDIQLKHGPLDFYAVTDHAEYLGVLEKFEEPAHPLSKSEYAPGMTSTNMVEKFKAFNLLVSKTMADGVPVDELINPDVSRSAWLKIQDAANRYYKPGEFTTFIAYEWTLMPDNKNLHRNVIFNGTEVPEVPVSRFDAQNPIALWAHLDELRDNGIDSIAIPHNSNLSAGMMFPVEEDYLGRPIDAEYAETRMRNEPLVEITQIKGSSETHPALSPNDDFAGFEIYQKLIGKDAQSQPQGSYVRQALKDGIQMHTNKGHNPYAMGVIGSSDSHNGGAPIEEDDYFGKVGVLDGDPASREAWRLKWGASGLAAVWAEENTRESIFSAMKRKETYATSGPRIKVRFFAGWNFDANLHEKSDFVESAYKNGVSMGGELYIKNAADQNPMFVVSALKDAKGANLDRIQIIKGWVDSDGSQEKVYDVALSDESRRDLETGTIRPVGFSVDVAEGKFNNSIGKSRLSTTWTDPDFNPSQRAFYYARVLEIPTPRWSTIDAIELGKIPPASVPVAIQERAYTSPIWIHPVEAD